jgi:UDP-3-O-acyl N-acetylglucosamine deacetylase
VILKEEAVVRILTYRRQRTIGRPAEVCGVGYLSGSNVHLRFLPAAPATGIVFVRTDLGQPLRIPATIDQVTCSNRRTTLGPLPRCVTLVEHVLAALAGLRIDNCLIEIDSGEPPGLDGSSRPFVEALLAAGIEAQAAPQPVWMVETTVLVEQPGATLALHPHEGTELRASYFLNYGDFSSVGRHRHTTVITPEHFAKELASSRTFLLEAEALQMQRQGIGKRTRLSDLLVYGRQGPLGNRLRFADEPARHKILDLLGDLSLLGEDVRGHLVACRSGHPLNAELVRALARQLAVAGQVRRLAA